MNASAPRSPWLALLLGALLAGGTASAHEVVHEVRRDKAIAVRATHDDGHPLVQVAYEVYAPTEPKRPRQAGRTDRAGWLAFVPDAPGKWKVKVIEAGGHGFVIEVDAEPPPPPPTPTSTPAPTSTSTSTSAPTPTSTSTSASASASGGSLLRPLLGLAAIGAVFAALYFGYRKKGPTP